MGGKQASSCQDSDTINLTDDAQVSSLGGGKNVKLLTKISNSERLTSLNEAISVE